jgi:thioester reductase-like protein
MIAQKSSAGLHHQVDPDFRKFLTNSPTTSLCQQRWAPSIFSSINQEGIMKRFIIVMTAFVAIFSLCPQLWAKTFYLKNGEEIEYQSYRQKDAMIYLLINRDTEVEFPVNEVDLAKTLKAVGESKKIKHKLHAKRCSARKAVKHAVPSKKKETPPATTRTSAANPAPSKKPPPAAMPVPVVKPAPVKGGPTTNQPGNQVRQK